jgi:hypothetical protein
LQFLQTTFLLLLVVLLEKWLKINCIIYVHTFLVSGEEYLPPLSLRASWHSLS